ncbi:Solute carrier family 35 member F6 [Orchesella cincta]|uniref:Solute carrier family 35 member F6 n=1 Tax=Orchesella cincta TaxID=48709 RepID=A0A1D2NDJ6_ORCCI|nr:Solute carrier family 35 member F6 [Orchesella cincta]
MWTQKQLLIALLMVVTGSLNTLSTKWADTMSSPGIDGQSRKFNHPYLQACSMFVGEIMCLVAFNLVYFYRKRRAGELEEVIPLTESQGTAFNRLIFLPPAMMDLLATSTMYVGLNLTFASSFQMLRGSVIVFTGLLSVAFLNRSLTFVKWFGISFILLGLGIVGLSDFSTHGADGHGKNNMITGDLLIVMAQIISASQMVYEEKYVSKYNVPPLQAVGWEGVFGFLVLGFLLIPMYFIPVPEPFGDNPRRVLEDAIDGFVQLYNNPLLICAFVGTIVSIAFFNFAGVSVTKELSATTRMVLDSVRTLVIWMFSLAVSWQKFNYLQVIGFLFLIIGMCLYNNVVIVPTLQRWGLVRRPPLNEPPRAVFVHQVVVTPPDSDSTAGVGSS